MRGSGVARAPHIEEVLDARPPGFAAGPKLSGLLVVGLRYPSDLKCTLEEQPDDVDHDPDP